MKTYQGEDLDNMSLYINDEFEVELDSMAVTEHTESEDYYSFTEIKLRCKSMHGNSLFAHLLEDNNESIYTVRFDMHQYGPVPVELRDTAVSIDPVVYRNCQVSDCNYGHSGKAKDHSLAEYTIFAGNTVSPEKQFTIITPNTPVIEMDAPSFKKPVLEELVDTDEDQILFEFPDGLTEDQFTKILFEVLKLIDHYEPYVEFSENAEFVEAEGIDTENELDVEDYFESKFPTISDVNEQARSVVKDTRRPFFSGGDIKVLFDAHNSKNVESVTWCQEFTESGTLVTGMFILSNYLDTLDPLTEALGCPYTGKFNITLIVQGRKDTEHLSKCMTLVGVKINSKHNGVSADDITNCDSYSFTADSVTPWQRVN